MALASSQVVNCLTWFMHSWLENIIVVSSFFSNEILSEIVLIFFRNSLWIVLLLASMG